MKKRSEGDEKERQGSVRTTFQLTLIGQLQMPRGLGSICYAVSTIVPVRSVASPMLCGLV